MADEKKDPASKAPADDEHIEIKVKVTKDSIRQAVKDAGGTIAK